MPEQESINYVNKQRVYNMYIQQLKELHQLLEISAISQVEYEQQKEIIFKKMKAL